METFLQLLIYGLQLGSIYALIALGYTMVYGIIGLINFAHGDFLMVGAFVALFAVTLFGLGFVPALLISMIITGLLGVSIERIAYKPLRKRPRLSALITAIGVSIVLENFPRALPFIGPAPRPFPQMIPMVKFNVLGVSTNSVQLIMIALSVLLMVMLQIIVTKTQIGRKMRAVSLDKDAASLMGINVNSVISVTFFIGASLAAAGGIFYASTYPMIDVYMGIVLGLKAFIAAVLGGIGNIPGAMVGGIIMGIAEIFATSINSDLGYGIGFVILIFILLVRPAGIMGKFTIEKV
ncbi:MAG: branched-chain amino acid ABC transporter permease [Clostridiales bacterium]|nr:branched-chain amino acid ABC transporter permease [Eubacteriales bacterium]MDH7567158.1 branched-chain amino acid ABC transporter permease [Clostridiales bacterium]